MLLGASRSNWVNAVQSHAVLMSQRLRSDFGTVLQVLAVISSGLKVGTHRRNGCWGSSCVPRRLDPAPRCTASSHLRFHLGNSAGNNQAWVWKSKTTQKMVSVSLVQTISSTCQTVQWLSVTLVSQSWKMWSSEHVASLTELVKCFSLYLPTINLIVFVKTPFRARARDTAGVGRLTHTHTVK